MIGDELDSGDIIEQRYFLLWRSTKIGEVLDWMSKQIPEMFLTAAEKIEASTSFVLETQSKDSKDSLRCYPRKPEDGKIDWVPTPASDHAVHGVGRATVEIFQSKAMRSRAQHIKRRRFHRRTCTGGRRCHGV